MATAHLLEEHLDIRQHPGRRMTEDEFLEWCGDTRAEWVDGEVIILAPENTEHNEDNCMLITLFNLFVKKNKLGRVFFTNCHIRMTIGKKVVRRSPDLLFIANKRNNIIKRTWIEGAPDLAVELVSPDSIERDYEDKFKEYESAGVREYWLIDLLEKKINLYTLAANGRYRLRAEKDGAYHSVVLPGFFLKRDWLFSGGIPDEWAASRELGLV